MARTRDLTEYRGYWLPNSFAKAGPIEEYWACRERCVAIDLSPLRKFEVLGPDAETLLQRTLTRNVRKLAVGQVVYAAMCFEHGGMHRRRHPVSSWRGPIPLDRRRRLWRGSG